MNNKDLMKLLAKININNQQKNVILILSGVCLISVVTILYCHSKNKQLTISIDAEKKETDRLNVKLTDSNKILNRQQEKIKTLESHIKELQTQLDEKNKTS